MRNGEQEPGEQDMMEIHRKTRQTCKNKRHQEGAWGTKYEKTPRGCNNNEKDTKGGAIKKNDTERVH